MAQVWVRPTLGIGLIALLSLSSCASQPASLPETASPEAKSSEPALSENSPDLANVIDVAASGDAGAYTLAVTIRSPDIGCDRYADWWEVLSPDGTLLYRRILAHSHVDEQPFSRSGGPVAVQPNDSVIVRAHMNPDGYGGQAMQGSVAAGFTPVALESDFAIALSDSPPLPNGCAF